MAGVIPTDQWSIREKLCLASSVIRSGDQNWVSVSRAIKPFGEPGRSSDWFSQKNCACQYSALLETVDTPKRKRSERGEVVDTPGDLIVRKMSKERIAELKIKLEEDKAQYQQLQKEIDQIRSGQIDDKLQSMWDEIQEQKRAAEEALEARKAAAEMAKAAAAIKPPSKLAFHSPHKRRPPTRAPRLVSHSQSETSQGDSAEADEDTSQTPVKATDESGAVPSDASVQQETSASAILTSLAAAKEQQEQDALASLDADIPIDTDNDEAAERLLAATASDLVELLSPYPVDSPSSQSLDESSLPAQDIPTSTPAPRVKEPLILKIEKGVLKTKETKVEPQETKSDEGEMINVEDPVIDQQPTDPQGASVNHEIDNEISLSPLAPVAGSAVQQGNAKVQEYSVEATNLESPVKTSKSKLTNMTASGETDDRIPSPSLMQALTSPKRKTMSPEQQRLITQKLDAALYQSQELGDTQSASPVRWLRSLQDRKKTKSLDDSVKIDQSNRSHLTKQPTEKISPKRNAADTEKPKMTRAEQPIHSPDAKTCKPPKSDQTNTDAKQTSRNSLQLLDNQPKTDPGRNKPDPKKASPTKRSPRRVEADKNIDLTAATHQRGVIEKDNYHHADPSSADDAPSRDDTEIKVKKKGTRGRPPGSQRKSARGRTQAQMEEEDEFSHTDTPPTGRRTAGKDGAASGIASLISEDSKDDTHSEGEESDGTDKPSESDRDDLSASAGTLQSSYFLESLPNSPASVSHSEEDHAYKIWRKAIMLVWRAVASHKYANIFLHPVTDDIAPGYQSIVLRPINLITIKKNIESGCIRTTDQFHRDMMLMFQNAIMYNNIDQHVHHIATIMQSDVVKQIEEFKSTQLLVQQPDSTKMLRGRGKQGQVEEDRSRRSSTDTDTSGKKRRTRSDEN